MRKPIVIVFLLLLTALVVYKHADDVMAYTTGTPTNAVVLALDAKEVHTGRTKVIDRHLILGYTDGKGNPYIGRSAFSVESGQYYAGDSVLIKYNPNHPEEFVVVKTFWFAFFVIAMAVAVVLAFGYALMNWRQWWRSPK